MGNTSTVNEDETKSHYPMDQKPYQDHQEKHISSAPLGTAIIVPNHAKSANDVAINDVATYVDDDYKAIHFDHMEEEIVSPPGTIPSIADQIDDNDAPNPVEMFRTPQSSISVSTDPNTHSNANKRNDINDNTEETDECPIVSNMQSTKGESEGDADEYEDEDEDSDGSEDIVHTMDCIQHGEDSNNVSECDDDDEGFDSNSNTGDWGDCNESSYDAQDYVKHPIAPNPVMDEELVHDPKSTDNGKSSKLRFITGKAECRAWICEHCHSLNNLVDSINRNYGCIRCAGKYRPGQALIESKEQDKPTPKTTIVWVCNCSALTALHYDKCRMCSAAKPSPENGLLTFSTTDRVESIRPSEEVNLDVYGSLNLNTAKTKAEKVFSQDHEYHPPKDIKGIGIAQDAITYPVYNPKFIDERLSVIFGKPYRNSLFMNFHDEWNSKHKMDGTIYVQRNFDNIYKDNKILSDFKQCLGPKCLAINEQNGYIVMVLKRFIVVLRPKGATEYIICARYCQVRKVTNNTRVRFVGDKIYTFEPSAKHFGFVVYQFDEKREKIFFRKRIKEEGFSAAQTIDFVVTEDLLITLFDRWLAVYTLKPKVAWYTSVPYSEGVSVVDDTSFPKITPYAMEMCVYDEVEAKENDQRIVCKPSIKNYVYILCENNIISLHPTNPTNAYLHHATNVYPGTSFCNSKKYGTFWINKECNIIYQSGRCNKDRINVVCSLSRSAVHRMNVAYWTRKPFRMAPVIGKDIKRFESVVYDEGYGISGRLLIKCTSEDNGNEISMMYQLFNEDELQPLRGESEWKWLSDWMGRDTESCKKSFNFVVFVFAMLYGSDLIDNRLLLWL